MLILTELVSFICEDGRLEPLRMYFLNRVLGLREVNLFYSIFIFIDLNFDGLKFNHLHFSFCLLVGCCFGRSLILGYSQ